MKILSASLIAAIMVSGLHSITANAAVNIEKVYGNAWKAVADVTEGQSQVIYYRDKTAEGKGGAHVYVDGEFQSSLLKGMYTTFCLPSGHHSIGAFVDEAPFFQGKELQPYTNTFRSGKTYYFKYDINESGRPILINSQQAEQELKDLKLQIHTVNRSSTVEKCNYINNPHADYTLSSDVLFTFGKSDVNSISDKGHEAINELISKLRKDGVNLNRIQIIGHSDPMGSEIVNLRIGQQRASTVRSLLMAGGLPAGNLKLSTAGSSEPLVANCIGSRAEKIACYAPNRRVVVRVY